MTDDACAPPTALAPPAPAAEPCAASPRHVAAIDAGSNAIRVVIASASAALGLTRVEAERIPVRLGRNTFTHGELDAETLEAATAAFCRIRALFDHHDVRHYRAVATSAVRTARNRDLLLRRVLHEAGIELEVIDGQEEARLVRLAVQAALRGHQAPALLFDLGGGSLEVAARIVGTGEWLGTSQRIGTVRLMETFGLNGAISEDEARMIRRYVRTLLIGVEREIAEAGGAHRGAAIISGGNAEALAQLLGDRDERGLPFVQVDKLRALLPQLLELGVRERMSRFGVSRDRAEVLAIAALVFATVARSFRLRRLYAPGVGVRDGLLHELAPLVVAGQGTDQRAREQSLLATARQYAAQLGHGATHGEHVRRLSRQLFDQLAASLSLPDEAGIVLELAALLHDVGERVDRASHHKHSEYLIRHGRLPGLALEERRMVAAIARAHRRTDPDPRKHTSFGELDPERQRQARALTAILRLADGLDTDHRGAVRAVTARHHASALHIQVQLGAPAPEATGIWARKAELLTRLLEARLDFEVLAPPPRRAAGEAA